MQKPSIFTVALTGGIACGKTQVSRLFVNLGVPVIDTDDIAREMVAPHQPTLQAIVRLFGAHMLQADGQLNRSQLRQLIFSDAKARAKLNALMHPKIQKIMWQWVSAQTAAYCVCVIPLLIETMPVDQFDRILVVDCDLILQKQRLSARDGLSQRQVDQLLAAQCQGQQRLAFADDVLDNNGNTKRLTEQVLRLHTVYLDRVNKLDFSEKQGNL
jgi:dephospho-CoA kinase